MDKKLVCVMSVLLVVSNIALILLVAVNTEVYECCHCGEKFVPTMREYLMGAHTMKKRYLRCPYCHKKVGINVILLINMINSLHDYNY